LFENILAGVAAKPRRGVEMNPPIVLTLGKPVEGLKNVFKNVLGSPYIAFNGELVFGDRVNRLRTLETHLNAFKRYLVVNDWLFFCTRCFYGCFLVFTVTDLPRRIHKWLDLLACGSASTHKVIDGKAS
jgi:hypothetical protein